jgi:hypothetical protein
MEHLDTYINDKRALEHEHPAILVDKDYELASITQVNNSDVSSLVEAVSSEELSPPKPKKKLSNITKVLASKVKKTSLIDPVKEQLKQCMSLFYSIILMCYLHPNLSVRFCIPLRNAAGQELASYLNVEVGQTITNLLQEVYMMIGCLDLRESSLPIILFHLSKDIKSRHFVLDETGWDQLQVDWKTEVDKKGADSVVDVILPPDVCLHVFELCTVYSLTVILVSQGLSQCKEA